MDGLNNSEEKYGSDECHQGHTGVSMRRTGSALKHGSLREVVLGVTLINGKRSSMTIVTTALLDQCILILVHWCLLFASVCQVLSYSPASIW
jgi:hypothetical protein